MNTIKQIVKESFTIEFLSAVLSGPRTKDGNTKIKIRPVKKRDELVYQCEEHRNNQVYHQNLTAKEIETYIEKQICLLYTSPSPRD